MELFDLQNKRHYIVHQFARWCAFSATRSGCPLKARKVVYPLIDTPPYAEILSTRKTLKKDDFSAWHRENTLSVNKASKNLLGIGWAAKLINVYLKTVVYVGQIGAAHLMKFIHPPIDGGLWDGIKSKYEKDPSILAKTHIVNKIKDIKTYDIYETILSGLELITQQESWNLIEVEQLWIGTNYKA